MNNKHQIIKALDDNIKNIQKLDYTPSVELARSLATSAKQALAQATKVEDMTQIKNKLGTIEHWFKKQRASLVESNLIVAERIRTERAIGKWISENINHGGDRKSNKSRSHGVTLISDVGITKNDSSRWQKLAAIDEQDFEVWITENINILELSTAAALRLWAVYANAGSFVHEVETPDGKFDGIVIDPAWDVKKIDRYVAPEQTAFDYPTMSLAEIKQFPVQSFAADDCHLFLWTTQKYLPASFDVMSAWGFKYVLTMVWHKNGGFQPFQLPMYNCEFVLYGRQGSPKFIDTKAFPTCFSADRTGHSKKPAEFYSLIRRVCDGKLIDIFNRGEREGFESYGNQTRTTT